MEMQTLIIDEYIDYIIRSRRRFCSRLVNPAGTLQTPSVLWVYGQTNSGSTRPEVVQKINYPGI